MACPQVSGVVALGLSYAAQQKKHFKATQIIDYLYGSASDIESFWNLDKPKVYYRYVADIGLTHKSSINLNNYRGKMGHGMVNAGGLLSKISNTEAPSMTFPNVLLPLGGKARAEDGFFGSFISSNAGAEVWFLVFTALVFFVILAGVKNGVERVSKVMMPLLLLLATFVMVYSVTRPGALAGVRYFLVPRFEDFSIMTVVAAMGQMFYSLSIAMGILYTYGSYMHKDVDIEKSTEQVEFFDTGVAVLAGLMIIPAVFAFSGGTMENLKAGPSLAFITLPKVFASMEIGGVIGTAFFLMFFFAALTSAISLLETSVSTLQDELHLTRPVCCVLMALLMVVLGSCSAFGYGMWDHVLLFGMQILDFFDFLTNSIMMPIAALATCFLILKVVGFKRIADEVQISSVFHRRKVYEFFMKYLAPVCILVILLSSIANVLGLITM